MKKRYWLLLLVFLCFSFNGFAQKKKNKKQADNQFPYHLYAGQQDNSTVCIASKTISGRAFWILDDLKGTVEGRK